MQKGDFWDIALVQATSRIKAWSKQLQADRSRPKLDIISHQLWDSNTSAGKVVQYAAEKSMLKAERWAQLNSVEERARYISSALGHRKQPRINVSNPKLCPKGGGSIENLNDVQQVAPRLLTPDGPIRRLILQIPPGAGKTCTYLGVMAQFIGNGHTIVVVGDDDVFAVFKEGLRQCPAKVYKHMVEPDGKTRATAETVYLRDINPHMSAFCTVKSQGTNPSLQGSPYTCDSNALTWVDTRVYFFNFVMAGNWMQAWSEDRKNAKGEAVSSMYHEVSPFSNKLLLVVDEAHKLGVPSMEQTTERWKSAAALFPKYIASLGKDSSTNPFILAGTATVNTTQMPTLSLCLPRVIKGYTDSSIFVDNQIDAPPRLNLHEYLSPGAGFVQLAEKVTLHSYAPPKHEANTIAVSVKVLKERLDKFKGFASDDPKDKKSGTAPAEDLTHPCPVSITALRQASYSIFEPIDTAQNRKTLLDIWAGVVYIVDMSQDFRYYPTTNHPYPTMRAVHLPKSNKTISQEEYLSLLAKPKGLSRWTEVSLFADHTRLMAMVQRCLDGEPLDMEVVESLAPKWKAVADDLKKDVRLRGRSMIYPGAFNRKGCDDNYYLILLAFYLQARLRSTVAKYYPKSEGHQLVTVESAMSEKGSEPRRDAPAIYIVGDSTEGKYQKNEVDAHIKKGRAAIEAGKTPNAEDLVFMISTREFRERQYNLYNDEVCPGASYVPQEASCNTIVILGEGGHKALDLKCTSNGFILTTMPGGKFQQTQGRVKRSCAFKKLMDATQLWTVNVRTYLLWSEDCLEKGPVIDQALHSFYSAQYNITRYLEMIEAMAGVGCSNWEIYSNWKKTFEAFNSYPQGGFKCAHDVDPADLHAKNQDNWKFFFCSDKGVGAPHVIERGVSGDVDVDAVLQSTHGTCKVTPLTSLEAQSVVGISKIAKEALTYPSKVQMRQVARPYKRFDFTALPTGNDQVTHSALKEAHDLWKAAPDPASVEPRGKSGIAQTRDKKGQILYPHTRDNGSSHHLSGLQPISEDRQRHAKGVGDKNSAIAALKDRVHREIYDVRA